jgi:hypothetical protein
MKKVSLIAGMASLALAAVWSLPAAATPSCATSACAHQAHDKWPGRAGEKLTNDNAADDNTGSSDPTSVPEPGTLALLALGLGGLGVYGASRRKRVKA